MIILAIAIVNTDVIIPLLEHTVFKVYAPLGLQGGGGGHGKPSGQFLISRYILHIVGQSCFVPSAYPTITQ
jgi:hypothetical protein